MSEEKYYRIRTKEGAHINGKLKEDGSRSAIQFDKENRLQGPVDLIEVGRDELVERRVVYVDRKLQERSLAQVISEDALVPVVKDTLIYVLENAIYYGINWVVYKGIPTVKNKIEEYVNIYKDSCVNEIENKNVLMTEKLQPGTSKALQKPASCESVVHTSKEVDQIFNNMGLASLYIAASIRELSNTVIVDDGSDPERILAIQKKLKELTSSQVMSAIEFMLEDGNRDSLDQATILLFEAFRHKVLIVEDKVIPLSKYIVA